MALNTFLGYVVRKMVYAIFVMFGVIVVSFFLFEVLPGDPARFLMGQRADAETIRVIRKELGLDYPLLVRFGALINDLSPISIHNNYDDESPIYIGKGSYKYVKIVSAGKYDIVVKVPYLRRSFVTRRPISDIFLELLPTTFLLTISSLLIASVLGIGLGIVAAVVRGTLLDNAIIFIATLGISGPSFFVALLFYMLGYYLDKEFNLNLLGPVFTIDDFGKEVVNLTNLILPSITLGIRPLTLIVQLMRNSMIETLSEDYIRTAYSKGLSRASVIFKHALINALNPVITAISNYFAGFMAGAIFIEYVFNLRGVGWESVEALNSYDMPLLMGFIIFTAFVFIFTSLVVDIIYAIIDPRIKLQ